MKLSTRKKSLRYTAAQKNHNLLQYLQNETSVWKPLENLQITIQWQKQ